jgi:hypothetical protein
MNQILKMILAVSILGATAGFADVKKGKSFYMKKLKAKLGNMNGMKFVSMHTVDEWNELFEDDAEGFINAFSEQFPKASKVLHGKSFAKKWNHVHDFAVEYASDSGNIISCE